jgi:hypothetical protein
VGSLSVVFSLEGANHVLVAQLARECLKSLCLDMVTPNLPRSATCISDSHIRRRCHQGTFPKPVRVGQGLRGRKAWRREDIMNFIGAL